MTEDEIEVHVQRLRDRIGLSSPPETILIEAGAIRKFARSIGETNPIYFDDDYARTTRFGRIIAPPSYPSCLIFSVMSRIPGADPAIEGLPRVLHTDDIVESSRPIMAGDLITSTARLADAFHRTGKQGPMLFEAIDITQTDHMNARVAVVRMITVRY
ncbi:MAG: MaoC family dehydratase N-terminal domain-containing protein [Sphingorhabdus sp.]